MAKIFWRSTSFLLRNLSRNSFYCFNFKANWFHWAVLKFIHFFFENRKEYNYLLIKIPEISVFSSMSTFQFSRQMSFSNLENIASLKDWQKVLWSTFLCWFLFLLFLSCVCKIKLRNIYSRNSKNRNIFRICFVAKILKNH